MCTDYTEKQQQQGFQEVLLYYSKTVCGCSFAEQDRVLIISAAHLNVHSVNSHQSARQTTNDNQRVWVWQCQQQ